MLDGAICTRMAALHQQQAPLQDVCIATDVFNLPGFDLIAYELEQAGNVRLLLGTES